MDVTYEDIIEAREEARSNSFCGVSHVVLTEDTIDSFLESSISVSMNDGSLTTSVDDDAIGLLHQIDIIEGDRNVLITEDGTGVSL